MGENQAQRLIADRFIVLIGEALADKNFYAPEKRQVLTEVRSAVQEDRSLLTTNKQQLFELAGEYFDVVGALHLEAVSKVEKDVDAGLIKSEPSNVVKGIKNLIEKASVSCTVLAFERSLEDAYQCSESVDVPLSLRYKEALKILSEQELDICAEQDQCVKEIVGHFQGNYNDTRRIAGIISDAYQTDGGIVATTPNLPALNR